MAAESEAIARALEARYRPGQPTGHYESYFQRANHPTRPLAFWIRYTIFSPHGRPEAAIGELWAIFFDGDTGRHVAVKREVPIAQCVFERSSFAVSVADAVLGPGRLRGSAGANGHDIRWDLSFDGSERPLFLLPLGMYDAAMPKAKSLVGLPLATFAGRLRIDGREIDVGGWVGSQNHNWGAKHTDDYAWGQVAGFDAHPRTFLEVATARLKIGPFRTPAMTLLVLRHQGEEHRLNGLVQSMRARGRRSGFTWSFGSENEQIRVEGDVAAPPEAFVGLRYYNPPGGEKHCLNTKIARCQLRVTDKRTGTSETLIASNRAAFEILTDDRDHGIPIRA